MASALPDDLAWRLLESMLLIRRFEEAVLRMSQEGQFRGHYHLSIVALTTAVVRRHGRYARSIGAPRPGFRSGARRL